MKPYQQRVVQERAELSVKLGALLAFLASDEFTSVDSGESERLVKQYEIMKSYVDILSERINNFT